MILPDKAIKANNLVTPCEPRTVFRGKSYGLSCCGYDARADVLALDSSYSYRRVLTPDGQGISLNPGQAVLLSTIERFSLSAGVVGFAKDKSTWSRQHISVAQAVLEPGWSGYLSLSIVNNGNDPVTIVHGEPIAQIVFQWLDGKPESLYDGKYQNQEQGPQGARYERE